MKKALPAILAFTALPLPAATLFSSDFNGTTGVPNSGFAINSSGSATAGVTWGVQNASVTSISSTLSALSPDGGFFIRGSISTVNNIWVNSNLNRLQAGGTGNGDLRERGYSLTFALNTPWDLKNLRVIAGHTASDGNDQAFLSDLSISLSGGTLGAEVTQTKSQIDYTNTGPAFLTQDFDLTGTTLGAGTYTLDVYMNNLTGGGAFATFDGITLEAVPEPSTALLGALGMLVLLRRRR